MPPILALPGLAIGNAIDNSLYAARRDKVKHHIVTHYDALKTEVVKADGEYLEGLIKLLDIDEQHAPHVKAQWQKDYETMFENRQLITEDIMRSYARIYIATSSAKTKTLNGLSYTEASERIDAYLQAYFERFRLAIAYGNKTPLYPLLETLQVAKESEKAALLHDIMMRYDAYFIEPVVVGAMVAKSSR